MATAPELPGQAPWRWHLLAWLPWLILIVGCVVTWSQHRAIQVRKEAIEKTRFDIRANEIALALERKLLSNADLLRGVVGLFAASERVDRHEFEAYVQSLGLQAHYPGFQGIGYSQWIPAGQRERHQREVQAEGFAGYAISPAGQRDHYSSIVYLEPFDWRNQRAFGFDMYTEPTRQHAMRHAAESGSVSLTRRVTLVQETDQDTQAGFLIYLPIYREGLPLDTAPQRWQALEGWAFSPIRASDLVQAMLDKEFRHLKPYLGLRLYAADQPDRDQVLFDRPVGPSHGLPRLYAARYLDVHGINWLLELDMAEDDTLREDDAGAVAVLWGGGALTLTLALLAWVVQRSDRKVRSALAETVSANEQLAKNQAALRLAGTVMTASPLGIFVTDAQRRIVSVNPAFTQITGWLPHEVLGQSPPGLAEGSALALVWPEVDSQGQWQGDLDSRRADGSPFPQRLALTRVDNELGHVEHYVGLFHDITEQRQAESHMRQLAHHDYLTGLPNRARLTEHARRELQVAARYDHRPVLLFIDLDRFKPINDEHGHEVGDAVLVQIAQRLSALLRETDLVCRLGGDEFVVMLPDHQHPDDVRLLAAKLLAAIEAPFRVGQISLELSASIGVALYPEHGQSLDELIQSADAAMYRAKGSPTRKVYFAGESEAA